jgi:hypothetical protein
MSKNNKASVYGVGQTAAEGISPRALRTVKISARIEASIAAKKLQEISWGDLITRALTVSSKRDLYEHERVRYAVWAATSLDWIAREIPNRFPQNDQSPFDRRITRLVELTKFIQSTADARRTFEEILYAK